MTNDEVLKELKKISKIITLSNGKALETEIGKYATTPERKKIWVLIDGHNQTKEMTELTGVTRKPIEMFLKTLEDADLIEKRKYGVPPKRTIDYVPSEWQALLPSTVLENSKTNSTTNKISKEDEQNG